ncbi:MAG: zinc ribbon domain-containing protein [bacterium]
MPIYEYLCKSCETSFELLVRGEMTPTCPSCETVDLKKLISSPSVHSTSRKAMSMKAAKKRDVAQGKDRMNEQRKYELAHND